MIDEKVVSPPEYVSHLEPGSPQPQPVSIGSNSVTYPPPPATPPVARQEPQYVPPVVPSAAEIGAQYQHELFARCARGDHDRTTKYGVCGIICAVFLFPIGLICLLSDTETRCARCGIRMDR